MMRIALPLASQSSQRRADAGERNELDVRRRVRARCARSSANAVTDDSLANGDLSYGRRLDISLVPRLETWVTGGFTWGATDGTMFQMDTEIDTLGFTGGGRLRYVLHPHLAVAARVDIGTARTSLAIDGIGHRVSDSGWGAMFGARPA